MEIVRGGPKLHRQTHTDTHTDTHTHTPTHTHTGCPFYKSFFFKKETRLKKIKCFSHNRTGGGINSQAGDNTYRKETLRIYHKIENMNRVKQRKIVKE